MNGKIHRLVTIKTTRGDKLNALFTGSGEPRGGPHSIIATSPKATRVFCGSKRNSSRNTIIIAKKKKKEKKSDKRPT